MQRLSGLDASFLYFETRAQLLHVCGLIVLDGSELEGGYSFAALRAELARRVTGMPGFRRQLHDSVLNIDHPVWVEAENFDIDHHLHRVGLPAPGGDEELAELCGHLASMPIDRSMPLWQMYVIEGLPDGKFAVFAKMHHSTVDGVTGANMMSQLCTLTPEAPTLDTELVAETAGGSGALELAVGGALSRMATPWRLVSLLPGTLGVLPRWLNRARKGLAMPAPFTAPRTPFNSTITGHRSISYATVDLAEIKRVKNAFGTTVNDVVLAICSTALRTYLDDLGELPTKPLIAMVPMSVHAAESRPGTNRVSGMFMSLSTDIDDPVERLESIRDANTVAKDHTNALDANLLTDWAQFAAPSVFGSAVRMYSRLRLSDHHPVVHNLVISNVPGPNIPLYFLGAKIEKMLPMGPVFHGAGLNCTVMSLDGKLHFGFIGCKDLVSDPWPLANAVEDAMAEFVAAAAAREASGTPSVEPKSASELGAQHREQRRSARQASGRKAPATSTGATEPASGSTDVVAAPDTTAQVGKAPAKKAPAKKATAKKATAKKAPAQKSPATTVPANTAPVKKAPARKTPASTAPSNAAPVDTAPVDTAPVDNAPVKKAAAKNAADRRTTSKPTGSKPTSGRPTPTQPAVTTPAGGPTGPASGTLGRVPLFESTPAHTVDNAPGSETAYGADTVTPMYSASAVTGPGDAAVNDAVATEATKVEATKVDARSGPAGGETGSVRDSGRA